MVCDRKDDNSFELPPVDERKRKILDENTAGAGAVRRTRQGKGERSGSGVFHRCSETRAHSSRGLAVIDDA